MSRKHIVFITGASGFVGANLVRALLKKNYEIHILLRHNSNIWRLQEILPQLSQHKGDLQSKVKLKNLLRRIKPDYIFHLATYGAYSSQNNLEEAIQTNIVGLSNLLEASKEIPYRLFINTGSSSEYGYKKSPMKEIDLLQPDSYYAATKAACTLLSQVFAKKENKPIITLRLFSVFGPFEEPTRFIPTAIRAALLQKELPLTPGSVKRDFIYVEDVVRAYIQACRKIHSPGAIYNIGSGKQFDNAVVAKYIKELNNNKLTIKKGAFPKRSWDTSYWVADTTYTNKWLKWSANYSLQDGLTKTYKWFIKNYSNYKKIYE